MVEVRVAHLQLAMFGAFLCRDRFAQRPLRSVCWRVIYVVLAWQVADRTPVPGPLELAKFKFDGLPTGEAADRRPLVEQMLVSCRVRPSSR